MLAALLMACIFATPAYALEVRAYLDRSQVPVGQAAALTIEAQGEQNVQAPNVAAPAGVEVRYVGPSTQVSFVNGQVSATVSHRYAVTARRVGRFTLGPFTVSHDGRDYQAPAVQLEAVAAAKAAQGAPGRDQIQLEISVPRQRVYVQETLPLTVTLTVGAARIEDLQYPTLPAEGFTMERFAEPNQTREVRDGRAVAVLRFQTTITPLRPGTLELGPALARMALVVQGRRGRDPFFDGFLGDYRKEPIEVASEPLALEVMPLPESGRPPDFAGAVGHFSLEATARPEEVRVGDPVTVRIAIAGEGNLAAVNAPVLAAGDRFKAYPPQEVGGGPAKQKVFEQVLIPLRPDVTEVPAVTFSFFDTQAGRYQTLRSGPFPLAVRPAEEAQGARVVEADSQRERERPAETLGRDIVYIKEAPGEMRARGGGSLGLRLALGLLLPTLAYAGLWWWVRQRDRLRDDPRYARFTRAGREVGAALAEARRRLASGDDAGCDDALSRALRDYLAAKLDLPPGAVEAENVARRLGSDAGATAAQVANVLGLLERVRYAPSGAARDERESALRQAEEIVAALEKRRYPSGRGASAALLLLALAAATLARADDPIAAFYRGNALYAEGRFADAAAAYESALAGGQESAALYYNLGNAYMKDGRPGPAVLNYERARRLAPADVDVRTNLAFALEGQQLAPAESPWWKLALPLAERAGSGALAAAAVALYALVLAALAVRLLWPAARTPATRAALVAAALLLFAGANLGYRVAVYDLAEDAVVTAAGETPVRFEPSDDGTAHFTVVEGTLLHVLETRDGWLQVARGDGRRGWIPADACTRL